MHFCLTVLFGNDRINNRKSSLRPSSIPDHHLTSSLNPAVSGSIQYRMRCGRYIIMHNVLTPLCTCTIKENNDTLFDKTMRMGMMVTQRASTTMARSAKAMCPPVKHSMSPSTYHRCTCT